MSEKKDVVLVADVLEGKVALTVAELRDFIAQIAEQASTVGEPVDIPINHYFSKGVYGREMVVPEGAIVVGKIHKYENLNIMSEGEISILSIDGVKRVKAPFSFVGSPGSQRVFYMHKKTNWTVIHGTDETDVDKIEDAFIAKSYEEFDALQNKEIFEIEGE